MVDHPPILLTNDNESTTTVVPPQTTWSLQLQAPPTIPALPPTTVNPTTHPTLAIQAIQATLPIPDLPILHTEAIFRVQLRRHLLRPSSLSNQSTLPAEQHPPLLERVLELVLLLAVLQAVEEELRHQEPVQEDMALLVNHNMILTYTHHQPLRLHKGSCDIHTLKINTITTNIPNTLTSRTTITTSFLSTR